MALGVLALIQAAFLPGYVALRAFGGMRRSLVESVVLVVSLSLIVNYLFVLGTTVLHVYTRPLVFAFIGVEILASAWLGFRHRSARVIPASPIIPRVRPRGWMQWGLLVASAITVLAFAAFGVAAAARSSVFSAWDPTFSWNEWAYRWFENAVPAGTTMYPQLVPAVWSVIYKVLGNPELQSFPLALMPLFPVLTLAMFFDLGVQKRRFEYFVGAIVCAGAFFLLRPQVPLASGFVEPPLVFMVLVPLYLIELQDAPLLRNTRALALPLVIAAAAAVVKFNGGVALIVVVMLGLAGHVANLKALTARDWVASSAVLLGSVAVLPGFWYGWKALDFLAGRDTPNASELVRVSSLATGSTSLMGRLVGAIPLMPGGWFTLLAFTALVLATIGIPRARWVSLGVAAYTALWAMYLSYDFRNEFLVVPFMTYLMVLGVGALADRLGIDRSLDVDWGTGWRLGRPVAVTTLAIVAVAVAVASIALPDSRILAHELAAQRRVGVPSLDAELYEQDSRLGGFKGSILTDYAYLRVLPGFRSDPVRLEHNSDLEIDYRARIDLSASDLAGHDYILLSDDVEPEVEAAVQRAIAEKTLTVLFTTDGGIPGQAYGRPVTVRLLRSTR